MGKEYEKDVRSVSDDDFLSEERPRRGRRHMSDDGAEGYGDGRHDARNAAVSADTPSDSDPFADDDVPRPRRSRKSRNFVPETNADPEADEAAAPASRPRSRFSSYLMTFLSGNILSRAEVRKVYPYLLFVAFLMLLYISNVFRMQQLYRRHERLTTEVKELRAKSMTIASEKMSATRQSRIIEQLRERGIPLRESLTPNKVITE